MFIKKLTPFLIVIVLLIPLILPLFETGFFQTDDGNWMVIRLSAFHETLKTGQFPVRFLERLNHGYGYPVLNFLYPLPFYIGELVHLAGFSFVNSVKVLFGASFLVGALGMFLWAKKWGTFAAFVSSIIYSYFLYRITDVYVRASLGEAVAFIFVPFIFLFLDKKNISLAAFSLAALITSHNSVALMFLPVIFLYRPQIKIYILALGLSAFFWLPALHDLQFTRSSEVAVANFANYFLTTTSGAYIFIEIVVPTLLASVFVRKKETLFWAVVTIGIAFLTIPLSTALWNVLPFPTTIQFPWRFLAVTAFSLSALAGILASKNKFLGVAICLLFIIIGLSELKVVHTYYDDTYYTTNDDTTTVKNEYMPRWVVKDPIQRSNSLFQIEGDKLQVNKVYFPGLTIYVNGNSVPVDYQTNGFPLVNMPSSQDDVTIRFEETNLRKFANLLTLSSLLAIAFMLKRYNK